MNLSSGDLSLLVLLGMVALLVVFCLAMQHLKLKKLQIEKDHEKAILERVLGTVDIKADRTGPDSASDQAPVPAPGRSIRMVCRKCGSNMDTDGDRQVLFCPYCGAKELLVESDYVKEARINAASREKITEEKRRIVHDVYDRYNQAIETEHREKRKEKAHKAFLDLGSAAGAGCLVMLAIAALFIGLGLFFALLR